MQLTKDASLDVDSTTGERRFGGDCRCRFAAPPAPPKTQWFIQNARLCDTRDVRDAILEAAVDLSFVIFDRVMSYVVFAASSLGLDSKHVKSVRCVVLARVLPSSHVLRRLAMPSPFRRVPSRLGLDYPPALQQGTRFVEDQRVDTKARHRFERFCVWTA
ncbi:unnamed protein product [Soboliphyme baturini]|uniref:Uncharacterized protein n=1 Tax=Soboliphyme baturini TaxID=241478 RepID=A0A183IAX9_9BILA|nr:unnamed protein product [Soboliphyme baturini]